MAHASYGEVKQIILPQRLDKTLAYKAINILTGLSSSERRVATTLVDHFNGRTGRCDPSLSHVASKLLISTRTVIRSVNRLVKLGLFIKHRHGGHWNCNSYQPVWSRFREIEDGWLRHSRAVSKNPRLSDVSSVQRQPGHLLHDMSVTQTPFNNHLYKNSRAAEPTLGKPRAFIQAPQKGPPRKWERKSIDRVVAYDFRTTDSTEAARTAAERRWNADLLTRYVADGDAYAEAIECVDEPLREAATDAETKQRGAGMRLIQERLRERATLTTAQQSTRASCAGMAPRPPEPGGKNE